jgi:hypothetical protein
MAATLPSRDNVPPAQGMTFKGSHRLSPGGKGSGSERGYSTRNMLTSLPADQRLFTILAMWPRDDCDYLAKRTQQLGLDKSESDKEASLLDLSRQISYPPTYKFLDMLGSAESMQIMTLAARAAVWHASKFTIQGAKTKDPPAWITRRRMIMEEILKCEDGIATPSDASQEITRLANQDFKEQRWFRKTDKHAVDEEQFARALGSLEQSLVNRSGKTPSQVPSHFQGPVLDPDAPEVEMALSNILTDTGTPPESHDRKGEHELGFQQSEPKEGTRCPASNQADEGVEAASPRNGALSEDLSWFGMANGSLSPSVTGPDQGPQYSSFLENGTPDYLSTSVGAERQQWGAAGGASRRYDTFALGHVPSQDPMTPSQANAGKAAGDGFPAPYNHMTGDIWTDDMSLFPDIPDAIPFFSDDDPQTITIPPEVFFDTEGDPLTSQ